MNNCEHLGKATEQLIPEHRLFGKSEQLREERRREENLTRIGKCLDTSI